MLRRDDSGAMTRSLYPWRLSATQSGRLWLISIAALACGAYADTAHAAKWLFDASIESRATWTDNVSFEERGPEDDDVILELAPRLGLRGDGRRFRISGGVGLSALTYANGSRDNRYLPSVDLSANLEAIEQFFFIDAGIVARQGNENAFAPRPDGAADFNTVTTTQYRLAPSFQGRIGGDVQYRLQSSNSWTDVSGESAQADGAYSGEHVLRIDRQAQPLGWAMELARRDTQFESQSATPSAVIDSGRIIISYAVAQGLAFGVRGGYEKTNLVVDNAEHTIYGVEATWRPSERTDLNGNWERRFFGNGWRLAFNHRMPRVAWSIGLSRDVASFPEAFLTLPPTNNVAALLDAAFTTRFPDPTERARIVADLMARQGLPSSLATETSLFTQRVSLLTSRSGTVTFLGVRNSLAISIFSSKTQALPDSVFSLLPGAVGDLDQKGASVSLSHQFSAVTSFNVTGSATRTTGFVEGQDSTSRQRTLRMQVTHQLAPKSSAFVGARSQKFDSNAPGIANDVRENAAFVGLAHRF